MNMLPRHRRPKRAFTPSPNRATYPIQAAVAPHPAPIAAAPMAPVPVAAVPVAAVAPVRRRKHRPNKELGPITVRKRVRKRLRPITVTSRSESAPPPTINAPNCI
ncbi:unnamed protein product [Caenorhabditis brenneri]